MRTLPTFDDPDLLVGADTLSDAGIYRLREDLAIVQSVDFFAPLVDDPYTFGQIAAANALSDLYAHGAMPVTCLHVVAFPDKELPIEVLGRILEGSAERVRTAGAVVVGGHSVRDQEVKFGLSVSGTIDPRRMMTNAGARPGDVLILTKGLGTGVVTTALRKDQCPQETLEAATRSMVRLNDEASRLAMDAGARACTDITGFGLLGHALQLANASAVSLRIHAGSLPIIEGALDLAVPAFRSGASTTNREAVEGHLAIEGPIDERLLELVFDPQTSGGLLVCVPAQAADRLLAALRERGEHAAIIGEVLTRGGATLSLVP